MVFPVLVNTCCIIKPEPDPYPETWSVEPVAVHVKVVAPTEDCKSIFVAVCEQIWDVRVVFIMDGIGFTMVSIGVLVRLAQLFTKLRASA